MGKRGRKPQLDRPVDVMVSIPSTVAAKLELLLYDPLTGRPQYGGRSRLIQQLIREWIERQALTPKNEPDRIIPPPLTPDSTS